MYRVEPPSPLASVRRVVLGVPTVLVRGSIAVHQWQQNVRNLRRNCYRPSRWESAIFFPFITFLDARMLSQNLCVTFFLLKNCVMVLVYDVRLASRPKLITIASGDQFFLPDDSYYFWSNLSGQNYLQWVSFLFVCNPTPWYSWRHVLLLELWKTLTTAWTRITTDIGRTWPHFSWRQNTWVLFCYSLFIVIFSTPYIA